MHPSAYLLPKTFHSTPAQHRTDTEDALAVVQRPGRPDLIIITTCNPDWPEKKKEKTSTLIGAWQA
ncbi:unnamed protein product [Sphacelaria rigidula]